MVTYIWVKFDANNGLLPDETNAFHKLMLSPDYWHPTKSNFPENARMLANISIKNLEFKHFDASVKRQWFNSYLYLTFRNDTLFRTLWSKYKHPYVMPVPRLATNFTVSFYFCFAYSSHCFQTQNGITPPTVFLNKKEKRLRLWYMSVQSTWYIKRLL